MLLVSISLCDVIKLPTQAIGTLATPALAMGILSYYFFFLVWDAPGGLNFYRWLVVILRLFVSTATVLPGVNELKGNYPLNRCYMLLVSISLCDVIELPTLAIGTLSTPALAMGILSYYFLFLVWDAPAGLDFYRWLVVIIRLFVSTATDSPWSQPTKR